MMSNKLFAACANLAGAVGQCEGFLSEVETGQSSLLPHVRQAAGQFGKELGENFKVLRELIERGADPNDESDSDDDLDIDVKDEE